MNRKEWAAARETHPAVTRAIWVLAAEAGKPVQTVWEDPTKDELRRVAELVAKYIAAGDYPAEPDGRYPWGQSLVTLLEDESMTVEIDSPEAYGSTGFYARKR